MSKLGFRASSTAAGARRAPEAARVDARPSPGPPSIRDGEEASSIALISMKVIRRSASPPMARDLDGQAGDKSDDSSADDIPVSSLLVPNPPVGQAKNKKAIVADNSTNNSRLCQGGRGKATSGAKKSRRKTKLVAGTSKSLSIYQANKNRQPTNTKPMPKSKAVSVPPIHARDNVVQLRRKRRALLAKIRFRRSC